MNGNRFRKKLLTINCMFIQILYNFERLTLPNKSPPPYNNIALQTRCQETISTKHMTLIEIAHASNIQIHNKLPMQKSYAQTPHIPVPSPRILVFNMSSQKREGRAAICLQPLSMGSCKSLVTGGLPDLIKHL